MHDVKTQRLFLKPSKIEELELKDFYLGSSVTILSRTLRIVDFADNFTRDALGSNSERCIVFIRPGSVCKAGNVITSLEGRGFRLVNLKMTWLTSDELKQLFDKSIDYTQFPHIFSELSEKVMVAVELMTTDACTRIWQVVGEGSAGGDLEANFITNADLLVFAKDAETAACQAERIFGNPGGSGYRGLPRLSGTTLGLIKPHAVAAGLTGKIWSTIQAKGFCVSAARLFRLSKTDAAEFFEVYKGVAHEYPEMLDQLASGPCVAMEIAFNEKEGKVQSAFREFVGPLDPEVARFLRPETLRAKFGTDKVRNGIHCTDLPDDAELEVSFFFRILDK